MRYYSNEANFALRRNIPGVFLSRDVSYQFSNRVAFAWKLASLGIPTILIYLGFIGDEPIAGESDYFQTPGDWQSAFARHTAKHFPVDRQGDRINCDAA